MTTALLVIFAMTCGLLFLSGLWQRGGIYQFPFAASCVMLGFFLPQFIGLADLRSLPEHAVDKTLVMATLVAFMCWLGTAAAGQPARTLEWDLDERRLVWMGIILTLGGVYFYHGLSRLPAEMTQSSQWTGLPVAYLFFARMMTYGFAISLLMWFRTRSRISLVGVLIGLALYLDAIIIGGRRANASELFFFIFLTLWFAKGWALPRPLMVAMMVAGMLFVNSVGSYRGVAADGLELSELANIDFVGTVRELTEEGGAELMNAVYVIAAVDKTMRFDYGAFQWNTLVFSYVPAQLVGADLKSALMFPEYAIGYDEFFHTAAVGSTFTGLSDSFRSFWYFGAALFFGIAFVMGKLYRSAQRGSLMCQLMYMLLLTPALHSLTHHSAWFVSAWPHMLLFLFPALLFARKRRRMPERTAHEMAFIPQTKPLADR